MKFETIKSGVVAEYNGKFWGIQYEDGQVCSEDFGDISKATIHKSEFCTKATDMTWTPEANSYYKNPKYDALKKAKLKKIKVTTIFDVED